MRPTTRRTQGASSVTVGKATGQVVRQARSHWAANPAWVPCVIAMTNADTSATMMIDNSAPKTTGA